ncbi:MAG: hypothetical protein FWC65_02440, partial [Treponema sp.]|nr:hypothetical protein [Treponema sp.]
ARTEIEVDFDEAVRAGANYFIVGFIEYNTARGRAVPVGISVKVYDSATRQRIHEENFPAGSGRNLGDEMNMAQDAGRAMVSRMEGRT